MEPTCSGAGWFQLLYTLAMTLSYAVSFDSAIHYRHMPSFGIDLQDGSDAWVTYFRVDLLMTFEVQGLDTQGFMYHGRRRKQVVSLILNQRQVDF
ncbi:hypothetical protein FZEAL_3678 [Fusarium zealandicum]|uniref:Uncharacterized protein n=1 Tax=Fusarium zealandicum TaxID=1053134 RepID=A0A8H4XMP4_9HYPO|nr:hypothetical protein FZEAL_3678 [Fusarium zealandicum]